MDANLDKIGAHSYGVGITTLEEVFLKIGHGKNQEKKVKCIEDKELNDYSIAENNEKNFCNQVLALSRKKLIVMTRDRKNFIMDVLFPSLLIIIGLYLTTVELVSDDYPSRALNPAGFPQNNPMIYN